ncbi:MAG: YtfJ family protein [Rikenellaceae bacterium]
MRLKITLSILMFICVVSSAVAQEGRVVQNVQLSDLNNRATHLPHFGDKYLLIFYVDPDRVGQNDEFVGELKSNATLKNGKFTGVNIMNLKDAPKAPAEVAYKMARKRAEASGTPFLVDKDGSLSSSWRLGDCDNYSTIMLLSTSGEILFISKGKISEYNKGRFFRIIEGLN